MPKVLKNFRLDDELAEALDRIAKNERRSLTGQIEALIIEKAKAQGILPADWTPKPINSPKAQ